MSFYNWFRRRESGLSPSFGDEDLIMKNVYRSFISSPTCHRDPLKKIEYDYGAVFNLDFSPEGNILAAACEKKSIILYDAVTRKQTFEIDKAHNDNVNCVKFLDSRMFATCSDDTTIALWDIRNLKSKVRSLNGHSSWVKNVEYSSKDKLLVTSGFDGNIYTWDINSYTEQGLLYQKVFHTSGLMRCKISPDSDKLVICTTGGYLIVIHNLDLNNLNRDLCGFRPNMYRLMQLGRQFIPQAAKFDYVFTKNQKKNRVELISDFPEKNDAEVIMALQIHPNGSCCLSRNISFDESTEWICVHDIREESDDEEETIRLSQKRPAIEDNFSMRNVRARTDNNPSSSTITPSLVSVTNPSSRESESSTSQNDSNEQIPTNNRNESSFVADIWAAEVTFQDRACRTNRRGRATSNSYAYVYAISSGVLPLALSSNQVIQTMRNIDRTNHNQSASSSASQRTTQRNSSSGNVVYDRVERNGRSFSRILINPRSDDDLDNNSLHQDRENCIYANDKVNQNTNRLMYYAEEACKGKGIIKEPAFSSDGRIICSPFGSDIRLFGFSTNCSELPHALSKADELPTKLTEIKRITNCHSDMVVSVKFSPRQPLLVSSCLRGEVFWHHPDL